MDPGDRDSPNSSALDVEAKARERTSKLSSLSTILTHI